jgi:hypothetical protein
MAFPTHTLTSDWWTATDWIDPDSPFLSVSGAGAVEYLWSQAVPAAAAAGVSISAGVYQFGAPLTGQRLYLRVTSGSASVAYAQDVGARMDTDACGMAWYGDAGSDTGFSGPLSQLQVGHDDLTTRSGANPYEEIAYLSTVAAGLDAGDTVDNAWLVLPWICRRADRTLRVYGLEYATSEFAGLADWSDLTGLTKTAAYAEALTTGDGYLRLDVTTIIEELQGVSGWDTDSPVQLYVEDTGAAVTGADARVDVLLSFRHARLTIILSDGSSPTPGAGIGGP